MTNKPVQGRGDQSQITNKTSEKDNETSQGTFLPIFQDIPTKIVGEVGSTVRKVGSTVGEVWFTSGKIGSVGKAGSTVGEIGLLSGI